MNIVMLRRFLVAMILGCMTLLTGVHSARAQFDLDGRFYQIRQTDSNTSQLYRLNRAVTPYVSIPVGSATGSGIILNALAFSSVDGYMYALRLSSPYSLYRMTPTGPVLLGAVMNLPGAAYNSGTMDGAGNYYVSVLSTSTIYRIDVNTRVATAVPLSQSIDTGDFAVNPIDGKIYAASTGNPSTLAVIDINAVGTPKPVTKITITGNGASRTFGSVFFDPIGTMYAYENGGSFFKIDTATGVATLVSTAPSTSQSDGAVSPFTRERIDAVKSIESVTAVNATTFDVTFVMTVGNTGSIFNPNVQITESLPRSFVGGSPTVTIQTAPVITAGTVLTLNPAFNGGTDTRILSGTQGLSPGASTTVKFTARAVYASVANIPVAQNNQVYASSSSSAPNNGYTFPGNTPVPPVDLVAADESTPGTTLPTTPNGDDGNAGGTPFSLQSTLSGRVFEDVNYGGGAGRPITAAGTVGVDGVRVELYNADGTFRAFTTTATTGGLAGSYSFTAPVGTGYIVRVVDSTVASTRTGSVATLRGVQTFRFHNGAADGNRVGGQVPAVVDTGNGATGTSITVAGVLSGTQTGQAQSIARAEVSTNGTTGIDFGFNFDTIVNTNTTGQGSLAQFITNSNALSNTGLAQVGQTAGKETSIFMISNGGTQAGFSGQVNLLTGGVAVINVTTVLPAITGANANDTIVTGATQTTNVGNTNSAVLGVGGTVGVGSLGLSTVNGPEVQIQDGSTFGIGLDVQASRVEIHNLAILGFGNAGNNNTSANIRIGVLGSTITDAVISGNVVGTTATSFTLPGNASGGDNIRAVGADNGTIRNNLIGFTAGKGIGVESGADGWTVENNEVRGNAINNTNLDGVDVELSGSATVRGNLFIDNVGVGMDSYESTGSNLFINNTVVGNGRGNEETPGVRIYGPSNRVELNIIRNNYGAGILVQPNAGTLITRNSIYDNGESTTLTGGAASGQIGIDLMAVGNDAKAGTAPFVTPNDSGDGDAGGNGLLNFPVFESAELAGGNLRLRGWARPGATIELFIANPDPTGFGEGQTYLVTLTEGVADADATTSNYSDPQAGSDNTNRFDFTISSPGGVALGTVLTATATISNLTSEFSKNIIVTAPAPTGGSIEGRVYLDSNRNSTYEDGDTSTGLNNLFIKVFGPTGNAVAVVPVDATTGLYSAPSLADNTYILVLSTNNDAANRTPILPTGYAGTEAANGQRTNIVIAGGNNVVDQNFGLFQGSTVTGRVFRDNGAGGGTANDGIINGAETGLAGVTVKATNAAGNTVYSTAVTDADGNYSLFIPASAGATPIRIVETNPAAYVSSGASVGNSGGTYDRATDVIMFNNVVGTSYTGLNFGDISPSTFTAPGMQTTTPGNIALYPHIFTAGSSGTVTFTTASTPQPAVAGWQQTIFHDLNGNGVIDAGEPVIGGTVMTPVPVSVAGGGSINIVVQDFAPATVTNGASNSILVTATLDPTGTVLPNEVLRLTDVTSVGVSTDLELTKVVDKANAQPNDVLTYVVTYRNTGNSPLTNLVVTDYTPAFTSFVSASYSSTPAGLTAGTITSPGVNNEGAIKWTFTGSLAPGQSGTVTWAVRLDN
jgi:uncharacterized repeat protein (TIGR01451 family)